MSNIRVHVLESLARDAALEHQTVNAPGAAVESMEESVG